MNKTSPLHGLLDEGFSVPRGVGMDFSLGTHTFWIFGGVGVVVDFGASLGGLSTLFLEGGGTTFELTFLGLFVFFFCSSLFFLRLSTN
jgi:hypothetical protein